MNRFLQYNWLNGVSMLMATLLHLAISDQAVPFTPPGLEPIRFSLAPVGGPHPVGMTGQVRASLPDSIYKASTLVIRVFAKTIGQPMPSAVVIISSRVSNKLEQFTANNGRLERRFTQPDQLDIEIRAPGYRPVSKQLSIALTSSGKFYELDAVLEQVQVSYLVAIQGVNAITQAAVPGIYYTVTSSTGMTPIVLKPDPATGLAVATLPALGTYQITSTAPGYDDFAKSWVVEKERSDVLFQLVPRKTPVAEKPATPQTESTPPAPIAAQRPVASSPDSVHKPSILRIKLFAPDSSPSPTSVVAAITSQKTGKTERFTLVNGQLMHRFITPDEVSVQVSATGYTPVKRNMTIETSTTGKFYEFKAELERLTVGLTIWAIDSRTEKNVPDVHFTISGHPGMVPIALKTDPGTCQAKTTLPGRGSYTLTSTATGYNEVRKSIVLDSAQNEARVTLTAKPPVIETKPVAPTVVAAPTRPAANTPVVSTSTASANPFGAVEKGKRIQLDNIYFDQSNPVLRPESYAELDQLSTLLVKNPAIRIEIRGHTDNQGDFDLNLQLSRDRCLAVINYLVGKGIARDRLKAVGRGPLDPVAPNNNEENRKKNRRVEFEVL